MTGVSQCHDHNDVRDMKPSHGLALQFYSMCSILVDKTSIRDVLNTASDCQYSWSALLFYLISIFNSNYVGYSTSLL